jgi:very-short-patch-repair endonuclease
MMTQNYQKLKEKDSKRDETILSSGTVLTRMINECLQQESASFRGRRYKDEVLLKNRKKIVDFRW